MRGIVKRFPGVVANDDVQFELRSGEVHALVGENGAGKTTLMNVLAGVYEADAGSVRVWGRDARIRSPRDAIRLGIGMVHQELMLAQALTVTENVVLGLPRPRFLLRWKSLEAEIGLCARKLGLDVDPHAPVWQLSVGERQRVEILKALLRGARILLLDEPTAVLGPRETEELFGSVRRLVAQGHAVVLISHKLDEVAGVAHRFTVMRKGRTVVAGGQMEGTPRSALAELMVGRPVRDGDAQVMERAPAGQVVLSVREVRALGDKGTEALGGISFEVRAGEIVGVAGVAGNGQRELADVLCGIRSTTGGDIAIGERVLSNHGPLAFLRAGLAYVPEDRRAEGSVGTMSIAENLALAAYREPPLARRWGLDRHEMARHAARLAADFEITVPTVHSPAGRLSGGNLQRLILARELSRTIRLLVAAQPTRGLDVGATQTVHEILLRQRESGVAILLVSEDLSELVSLCDRLVVLYRGRIVGQFMRGSVDMAEVGRLMAGVGPGSVVAVGESADEPGGHP